MHEGKLHVHLPIHLPAYLLVILRLISVVAFGSILVSIRTLTIINIVEAWCDDHYACCYDRF